jgi:hypothetical protein
LPRARRGDPQRDAREQVACVAALIAAGAALHERGEARGAVAGVAAARVAVALVIGAERCGDRPCWDDLAGLMRLLVDRRARPPGPHARALAPRTTAAAAGLALRF